jgi:hypothetical protein
MVNIPMKNGAWLDSKMHEEMTFKQPLQESLDEKLFNRSLKSPEPNDFLEVASELKKKVDEIEHINKTLKVE